MFYIGTRIKQIIYHHLLLKYLTLKEFYQIKFNINKGNGLLHRIKLNNGKIIKNLNFNTIILPYGIAKKYTQEIKY